MEYIILAAGGNATAIVIVGTSNDRAWYEEQGRDLMRRTEHLGVEQAGFLNLETRHFEMSGGEFCGNAARSAAMLIAKHTGESDFTFTMSGYEGSVRAQVALEGASKAVVTCVFSNMRPNVQVVALPGGDEAELVDLGGIVHVLTREAFVNDREVYETRHREITKALGLSERPAVGVIWIQQLDGGLKIHPVVWVRGIDSFFYETACGSGSIATGIATGETQIVQPSGESIQVVSDRDGVHLTSAMEISHVG